MAVTIRHNKVCGGNNDPSKEVSRDAWNDYHFIEGLGSAAEANVEDFDPAGTAAALVAAIPVFSGDYGDLSNTPTLGDAAAKNTGTGAGDVAAGNHTHPGGSEAFPVGSVFIAVVSTDPGTLLGYGTWEAFGAGRVLVGLNSGDTDFDTAEETGGSKTSSALIAHTHSISDPGHNHTQNSHLHVITSQTATTGGATSYEHGTLDTSSAEAEATEVTGSTTATNNASSTGITGTASAGSGASFSIMQPYIVVHFWKRTA